MTVPNTPPDPAPADVHAVPDAAPDPYAPPAHGATAFGEGTTPLGRRLLPEVRLGAGVVVACLVVGLVVAGLWAWLAPKVPLVVDGNRILYADPEGEQRAGADAVFVLIALGAGIVTALGAFLVTRRRGGGISVAVGLTVGGLLGSIGAWRIGRWLGPSGDLIGEARRVGDGGHFDASIDLGALGALLVWPMAAMVVLLLLSAAFGKREEDPPPYWAPVAQAPLGEPMTGVPTAGVPATEAPTAGVPTTGVPATGAPTKPWAGPGTGNGAER